MADPAPPKPALPAHPATYLGTRLVVLAGVFVVPTVIVFAAGAWWGGGMLLCLAVASAVLGVWLRRALAASAIHNAAVALLLEGRDEESSALLDAIPRARRTGYVGSMVAGLQTLALCFRGDAAGAVAVSGEALARRPSLFVRAADAEARAAMRAVRGLMFAALGDTASARAEAARVDATPHVRAETRGVAALVRAVVHAREGERAELAAELARSRPLLDQITGRMTALTRTLTRLAAAPTGGAYRAPAARSGELSAVGRWVAMVVPSAAPFAPRVAEGVAAVDAVRWPTPSEEARIKVRADRALARRRAPRLWRVVVAGSAGFVVATFAAHWPHRPTENLRAHLFTAAMSAGLLLWVWRLVSLPRTIRAARELHEVGRGAESDAALAGPARSIFAVHAATARFELATHAEARDDLAAALDHVDAGLGRLLANANARAASNDVVYPGLVALRARVLAALDRTDEALAELEMLTRDFPGYAFAGANALMVRVVVALRRGDRALARDLARNRAGDVELPRHAELLCALVLGEAGWFEADGERERLDAELAARPGERAWVERVAPGLIASLRATTGVRVAVDDSSEAETVDVSGAKASAARVG